MQKNPHCNWNINFDRVESAKWCLSSRVFIEQNHERRTQRTAPFSTRIWRDIPSRLRLPCACWPFCPKPTLRPLQLWLGTRSLWKSLLLDHRTLCQVFFSWQVAKRAVHCTGALVTKVDAVILRPLRCQSKTAPTNFMPTNPRICESLNFPGGFRTIGGANVYPARNLSLSWRTNIYERRSPPNGAAKFGACTTRKKRGTWSTTIQRTNPQT